MVIEAKIMKFGNSLRIIFPKKFVKENKLKKGERVILEGFRNPRSGKFFLTIIKTANN